MIGCSLVNQTVFLRDTHAHGICGRGEGRGKGIFPSPKKIRLVHETRLDECRVCVILNLIFHALHPQVMFLVTIASVQKTFNYNYNFFNGYYIT